MGLFRFPGGIVGVCRKRRGLLLAVALRSINPQCPELAPCHGPLQLMLSLLDPENLGLISEGIDDAQEKIEAITFCLQPHHSPGWLVPRAKHPVLRYPNWYVGLSCRSKHSFETESECSGPAIVVVLRHVSVRRSIVTLSDISTSPSRVSILRSLLDLFSYKFAKSRVIAISVEYSAEG